MCAVMPAQCHQVNANVYIMLKGLVEKKFKFLHHVKHIWLCHILELWLQTAILAYSVSP